jgi:cytochrome c-type biogenesis protein
MILLILSFIAGVLTVAAPCVLPLLPVIIGGSLLDDNQDKDKNSWLRPVVIAASLAVSVLVFTLLIKATTLLLGVPQVVWQVISGGIVIVLGFYYLFPVTWAKLAAGSFVRSNMLLSKAYKRKNLGGAILIGAALGPVFSSCSPTYALIVATILPTSFVQGLVYLIAYSVGMSVTLLLIAFLGQAFIVRLRWLSNPAGWLKKIIGFSFLLVGIAVVLGLDKDLQSFVLGQGWYDPISNFEQRLRD